MTDQWEQMLHSRIADLQSQLTRERGRVKDLTKSRAMWRGRARSAESAFSKTLYSRRRIRFLEDQLLKLNGERREANRFEADQARRSEREAAAA
jgi:phage-related minor tail protein